MLRVLFVLGDTDDSSSNSAAIDLHRGLVSRGVEMRTVALGPGRSGGLDRMVPVLSPASRSLAAVTQVRREQRWADVVVCWGVTASVVQRLAGSRRRRAVVAVHPRVGSARSLAASLGQWGAADGPDGVDPDPWAQFLDSVRDRRAEGV